MKNDRRRSDATKAAPPPAASTTPPATGATDRRGGDAAFTNRVDYDDLDELRGLIDEARQRTESILYNFEIVRSNGGFSENGSTYTPRFETSRQNMAAITAPSINNVRLLAHQLYAALRAIEGEAESVANAVAARAVAKAVS